MSATTEVTAPSVRLTSLDQFRGYTMLGMILVNYLGIYKTVCPKILTHSNDYCSYADTIMPQFFFAAGFALRLSLGRRIDAGGKMPWGRAIRRILGLAAVAIAWYSFGDFSDIVKHFQTRPALDVIGGLFKGLYFQTLLHIAVTSLWILPVINKSAKVRLGYAVFSGVLHFLVSWWFNFNWVHGSPGGIDGGPLGFLAWAVPTLSGTLACDLVKASGPRAASRLAGYGILVMLLGWGMSNGTTLYNVHDDTSANNPASKSDPVAGSDAAASTEAATAPQELKPKPKSPNPDKIPEDPVVPSLERIKRWDRTFVEPPFVPPPDVRHRKWNYWMMSQKTCNLSYLVFAAGLSLLLYSFFLVVCDKYMIRVGVFRTLGTNSLAAYIFHDLAIMTVVATIAPRSATSASTVLLGLAAVMLMTYGLCRLLEFKGWYIRV